MHMADALISPATGGAMWVAAAGTLALCCRRIRARGESFELPLTGVMSAFVFAAQMINFTIPATGSSGHLGGGLLLAILLGPEAALVSIASILTVQALFFADGGLLALGCNIINLGLIPAFVAYPLIFRPLLGTARSGARLYGATLAAAVVALQLGAFGVVTQTTLSGVSALPFSTFAAMMQPIHLAIGLVEGVITAAVVRLLWQAHPELAVPSRSSASPRLLLASLVACAALVAGALSPFASEHPDGLEWSVAQVTGEELEAAPGSLQSLISEWQAKGALLPGYDFRPGESSSSSGGGSTVAGLLGGALTLGATLLLGATLRRHGRTP